MSFLEHFPATSSAKVLISIPHAGTFIPEEFRDKLTTDEKALRQDLDYGVDQLIDIPFLNDLGAEVVVQKIHRFCLDLNRPRQNAVFNWPSNSRGVEIVKKTFSDEESEQALIKYYDPFYQRIAESKAILHLDLHSMPSRATEYHLKKNPHQQVERPLFCISNRNDETCPRPLAESLQRHLIETFSEAAINHPYLGGEVIAQSAKLNKHSLMLEINRSLYMHEEKFEFITDLPSFKARLMQILKHFLFPN